MSLLAKQTGESYPPVPEDTHHAICYSVVDLGTQHSDYFNNDQHKVCITWELPNERIDIDKDNGSVNLPRAISKIYTLSLSEKANLYSDLISWRGREFTERELDGFDVFKVAGANCLLQVVHSTKGKKVYANVTAVMKLLKSIDKRAPENPIVTYEFAEQGLDIPKTIPDWIKNMIYKSAEYAAMKHAAESTELQDAHDQYVPEPGEENDDIPF